MARLKAITVVSAALLGISLGAASANEPTEQLNSNAIWFENWVGLSNATLKVAEPSGRVVSIYAESGTPVYQLQGSTVADGVYTYELTAATGERTALLDPSENNGRGDAQQATTAVSFSMSGAFAVERGAIVPLGADGAVEE
ncbi:hypothetical protein [Pseudoruegeria sp. SHC-113]|uniref:hypothetical protein n=1 Tax=Pseudoruegeria sp. SHC-113 TaxID=2855439 RepID=UPI0021BA8BA1|nr:hypothetical protein [Pseudoruegeria sp. SHC-113]MCT8161679.1 hypothetical protein [Pseudoruegeria sp. SHC-113]